jgi:ABC-type cobalamin transport system permease subunit
MIGLVVSVALVVALGNPLREGVVIGIGAGVGLVIADLYTHYDLSAKRS